MRPPNDDILTLLNLDPGLADGAGARIAHGQFMPAQCQEGQAPAVLAAAFQRIAGPFGRVGPLGAQVEPAAVIGKVGVKK